jgi:hypothetical protein
MARKEGEKTSGQHQQDKPKPPQAIVATVLPSRTCAE